MREIKFRGWSIYEEQWVYGGVHIVDDSAVILINRDRVQNFHAPVELLSIGQFTGLLDKNGVEIYEGDIVTFRSMSGFECSDEDYRQHGTLERPREVKYKNGEFAPREEYCEVEDGFYSWRQFDFEVIGNIHQNPDLLKLSNIEKT